jgi:hypothetical protein
VLLRFVRFRAPITHSIVAGNGRARPGPSRRQCLGRRGLDPDRTLRRNLSQRPVASYRGSASAGRARSILNPVLRRFRRQPPDRWAEPRHADCTVPPPQTRRFSGKRSDEKREGNPLRGMAARGANHLSFGGCRTFGRNTNFNSDRRLALRGWRRCMKPATAQMRSDGCCDAGPRHAGFVKQTEES